MPSSHLSVDVTSVFSVQKTVYMLQKISTRDTSVVVVPLSAEKRMFSAHGVNEA